MSERRDRAMEDRLAGQIYAARAAKLLEEEAPCTLDGDFTYDFLELARESLDAAEVFMWVRRDRQRRLGEALAGQRADADDRPA